MSNAELKAQAKQSLKGKYGEAIKMMVVYSLISFVVGFVLGFIAGMLGLSENATDIISSIASFVLSAIFQFGVVSFYLKVSRNEEVTYKELFAKKELWLPYITITILTGIFAFLWSLLFVIPGIIASIKYSQVYLIALDNPELSAKEVINKSKQMMEGHKMDYFMLNLSFIGWAILGVFTLGILYFWLIPYMSVTQSNFYNSIKMQNNI